MGKFLQFSLPCHSPKTQHDFDQQSPESDHHHHLHSDSSTSSSSSNSSLYSQPSLPSVPSLTPPLDHPTTATHHHCVATLKGHTSYVFSLSLAGKHLLTGSSDGQLRLWDRHCDPSSTSSHNMSNRHTTLSDKTGHSAVKSIVVLANKIFTAHSDHKIRVWKLDPQTDSCTNISLVATLPTLNDRCMALFSTKNHVKVRRHKTSTWVHHVDAVSALALSRDGSLLYSVSWDRSIKVWRTSDYKCVESIQNAHDDAINAVACSVDGYVYTGSADKKIKVWRKNHDGNKKHTLVSTLEKHNSAVNALALSTDGSALYSGACDRSIVVWEKCRGDGHMAVSGALRGHSKAILCLAVASDLLCSGSADRTVRVWRRSGSSYSCVAVLEGHSKPVKCLTAVVDGKKSGGAGETGNSLVVYSGSLDFDVKVWQVRVPFSQ